jgi:hypothetical protein
MSVVAIVFIILGIAMTALASYTLVVLTFGGTNVLSGYSLATVYTLLVVGLVLLVVSIIVWISSCKPTAVCSKIILVIFSIVMIVAFVVQVLLLIFGCVWLGYININITEVTGGESPAQIFNETVQELQDLCCTNSSVAAQEVCEHIIDNADQQQQDCNNFGLFYQLVVEFLTPILKWVAVFLGVVAFLNLVAFVCSCRLICSRKRSAYYKPATATYQSA